MTNIPHHTQQADDPGEIPLLDADAFAGALSETLSEKWRLCAYFGDRPVQERRASTRSAPTT